MSDGVNPSPKPTLWGFPFHTHNILGGLVVVALGLASTGRC
jgi:hypothetical protein